MISQQIYHGQLTSASALSKIQSESCINTGLAVGEQYQRCVQDSKHDQLKQLSQGLRNQIASKIQSIQIEKQQQQTENSQMRYRYMVAEDIDSRKQKASKIGRARETSIELYAMKKQKEVQRTKDIQSKQLERSQMDQSHASSGFLGTRPASVINGTSSKNLAKFVKGLTRNSSNYRGT